MTKTIKSHDWFFKQFMTKPRVHKEFFELHLPSYILENIDLDTIKIEKTTFLNSTLGSGEVDMLFSVNYHKGDLGYIYLLTEQQTVPNKWMAFRIAKYILRICDEHLAKYKKATMLPLVYPLVFYNGTEPYNVPKNLWGLFSDPILAKSFFTEDHQLVELQKLNEQALSSKLIFAGVMELMMKRIKAPDIVDVLGKLKELLQVLGHEDTVYMEYILWYTSYNAESTHKEKCVEILKDCTENKEVIMNIAEAFRQDGKLEGMEKGLHEGMEKGLHEGMEKGLHAGKLETAKAMLKDDMDIKSIMRFTGLTSAEIKNLAQGD